MSYSFTQRAVAVTLASFVLWGSVRVPVARADEPDSQASSGRESFAAEVLKQGQFEVLQAPAEGQADRFRDALQSELLEQGSISPDALPDFDEAQSIDQDSEQSAEVVSDAEPVVPLALPTGPAKSAVEPNAISLPKGEGSIEGMGESFTADLSSGAGTLTVPIVTPKARAGVGPGLAFSYSTTGGNGPLGIGWSLGVPFIARQTDKGLPRYRDQATYHPEEDRFIYNGGQELVPVSSVEAARVDSAPVPSELLDFQQYRARVEGGFMRFFRAPDSSRWVVQSKDGTRFEFGALTDGSASARTSDPEIPEHVFAWHLVRTSDPHGATVQYRYLEDRAQVYLSDIYYDSPARCAALGTPLAVRECAASLAEYGRRVHLVYESRQDVFSSYATTYRIETAKRLARVEVTSAQGEVGARYLVRRYHLRYAPDSFHSLLEALQIEGRPSAEDATIGAERGNERVLEANLSDALIGDLLPPMRFGYTRGPGTSDAVEGFGGIDATVQRASTSPDHSLDEGRADLFDVNADGLPDLLVTDPARFKAGAGVYFNGFANGQPTQAGDFSPGIDVGVPQGLSGVMTLSNANILPMDVDGDGRSDLLHMPRRSEYGYFVVSKGVKPGPSRPLGDWSFAYVEKDLGQGIDPRIDLGSDAPRIKTLDVNNDHLIDIVRTTGKRLQTWLNLGHVPGGDGRFGSASYGTDGWTLSTAPVETCLPVAGRPLDFADPAVSFADMNGDGIVDIVRVEDQSVVYWPGRGEGAFGVGRAECDSLDRGARHITMESAPKLTAQGAGVRVADLNADGTSDIVQIGVDRLSVWWNRAGTGFAPRILVKHTPFTADVPGRVRIADINGNGTSDIVFGHAGKWSWIDPMGGVRPRLLSDVDNGLGALSTLEYEPSSADYFRDLRDSASCDAEDLECFTWQKAVGGCDSKVSDTCLRRSAGSPVISTVVRRMRSTDRFDALGREENVSETEYRYHDGYFEGIEQEFRGFGAADAIAYGDGYGATSIARTYFHQGKRPSEIAGERLAENPNEALKGREFLTEVRDEAGAYLSTTHATYAVRKLLDGLDGRIVSYAYVRRSDEYGYDHAPYVPFARTEVLDNVVREVASNGLTKFDEGEPAESGDDAHAITLRSEKFAHIARSSEQVDNLGHVRLNRAHGRVGANEIIDSYTVPVRVDDSACGASGYLFRTAETYVRGHEDQGQRLSQTNHRYSPCGDAIASVTKANLPREGAFDFTGDGTSLTLTQTDQLLTSSTRFDAWGQPLELCTGADLSAGPRTNCLRYASYAYDPSYGQFVEQQSIATGMAAGDLTFLTSRAQWDEGLGQVTETVDPNGLTSRVARDGLGRFTAMTVPNVASCAGANVPTVRVRYEITNDPELRPVSVIRTIQELSCTRIGLDTLETYTYLDGLGRTRATLTEGERDGSVWEDGQPHAWVRSGISVFGKKGQVWASYQPDFYDGDPRDFAKALQRGSVPYTQALQDAFGRPSFEINEDKTFRQIRYTALGRFVSDENDTDSSSPYAGTPTYEESDGHGRAIQQELIQRLIGSSEPDESHELYSFYRADGVVLRVVRGLARARLSRPADGTAGLEHWVSRSFIYDSVGRRIASRDPDTESRAAGVPLARRTWRYLFSTTGDLAAVRDPRGCGQNFLYDRAGRLIGEQYVSCGEAQRMGEPAAASIPAGAVVLGPLASAVPAHVAYHFDAYPTWAAPPTARSGVLGRATGITDRAQRSAVAYDDRGNAVWAAKQIAMSAPAASYSAVGAQTGVFPTFSEGTESAPAAVYDTAHTYTRTASFDHAGRNVGIALPVDPDFPGGGPTVGALAEYTTGGKLMRAKLTVDSARYDVLSKVAYTRDGLIAKVTYGDGARTGRASTTAATLYDSCRRPFEASTLRTPAAGTAPGTLSAVSIVAHSQLDWDPASNLTDIYDKRLGQEWPAAHRPQSVHVVHDALYRVTGAFFEYTTEGNTLSPLPDVASDWRDTETRHRAADPMHSKAAPRLGALPSTRVVALVYESDWLANTTSWTDDAHSFYERSIGAITNGTELSPNAAEPAYRPSALYLSSNLDPQRPSDKGGYLELEYGVSGNVLAMTVRAQCTDVAVVEEIGTCRDPGGRDLAARRDALHTGCRCAAEQHYSYRYDELNRMSEAQRFDRASGLWSLKARQRYRYDSANQRTVKETTDVATADTRATLYVIPGDFERRGLRAGDTAYAAITGETETQYLVAGARVAWKNRDALTPGQLDPDHRITFAVTDLIQSTSAVVDLMSGELLEVTGFYPNGAREHWIDSSADNASAVPLETIGFTGKEADEEVGLTYFGERYLIQRIGRWSTPDPLSVHAMGGGEAGNAYHYVSGNLLQARDPLGLRGWDFSVYKQWELTYTREGNHLEVYVPAGSDKKPHENSGMTVGVGADGKNGVAFLDKVTGVSSDVRELMAKGVGKKGQSAQDEIDTWSASHGGQVPSLTRGQSDQLMQEEMAPRYLKVARERSTGMTTNKDGKDVEYKGKFKADNTVSTERFDSLDPIVKEVLIDIAWNSAYYAHGKENDITDAIREGDTVQVLKNLQKFNNEKLKGTWGAPIRDQWLSDRIANLEGTAPEGSSAASAPSTPSSTAQAEAKP